MTTSVCWCCCVWWWEVGGGWNMSVWWDGGAGPGCWGGWLKGNMLKEEGAALCSMLRLLITCALVELLVLFTTRIDWVVVKTTEFCHWRWILWCEGYCGCVACVVTVVWPPLYDTVGCGKPTQLQPPPCPSSHTGAQLWPGPAAPTGRQTENISQRVIPQQAWLLPAGIRLRLDISKLPPVACVFSLKAGPAPGPVFLSPCSVS